MEFARKGVAQPKPEGGFDFTSRCENASLTRTFVTHLDVAVAVPDGHAADHTAGIISGGRSSGRGPLLHLLSARSDTSQHATTVSLPVASTSTHHLSSFKNYLLCQDPTTGHLTLVPVRCATQHTTSDISESLRLSPGSPRELRQTTNSSEADTTPRSVGGSFTGSVGPEPQRRLPPFQNLGPPRSRHGELAGSQNSDGDLNLSAGSLGLPTGSTQGMEGEAEAGKAYLHPALREAISLLKGEFDYGSCTGNDQQDLAMGIGNF